MQKIFGEVDRTKEGKIKSQYPAWYYEQHIDELKESIRHRERQLESDLVIPSEKGIQRERLRQEKERLVQIESSKPTFSGVEKDELVKIRKELGDKIKASMFSKGEMDRGVADAHEEARRMVDPIIELKTERELNLAEGCGIKIKDGKISRKDAEKMWKISGKSIGDGTPTNVETLRRG